MSKISWSSLSSWIPLKEQNSSWWPNPLWSPITRQPGRNCGAWTAFPVKWVPRLPMLMAWLFRWMNTQSWQLSRWEISPKILWQSWWIHVRYSQSRLRTAATLFLATSYGTMVCYDAKTGTKYWEKDFGTNLSSLSPMLADGKVYALDKKGVMHIFKPDKAYSSIKWAGTGEDLSVHLPCWWDDLYQGDKNLYCIGK